MKSVSNEPAGAHPSHKLFIVGSNIVGSDEDASEVVNLETDENGDERDPMAGYRVVFVDGPMRVAGDAQHDRLTSYTEHSTKTVFLSLRLTGMDEGEGGSPAMLKKWETIGPWLRAAALLGFRAGVAAGQEAEADEEGESWKNL